ncbi:MAG TPA: phosphotransferase [Patescibacteria group bacterium]|nr:phosphotransferase [Patescibacteria group bacterium]
MIQVCEKVVGGLFNDQVVAAEQVRFSAGGNGMHRRETWRCTGDEANYYVKLFEASDSGQFPEIAFLEGYAPGLDFVAPGRVFEGLDDAPPFANAIVTKEVPGEPLDALLQHADPDEQYQLSAIGAVSLSRLHTIPVEGFGLLHEAAPKYPTWGAYVNGMADSRLDRKDLLRAGGLTDHEVAAALEVVRQSADQVVTPVLCHGDPKAAHTIILEGHSTLLDFGRAQGNIPFRDCLQYGSFDPTYLAPGALVETVMDGQNIDVSCRRTEALIKLTGLVLYTAATGDSHCEELSNIIREVLTVDGLPAHLTSVSNKESFVSDPLMEFFP